ncbi:hypothetical protein BJ878DRAFT_501490 [Calycina marina]|uniref:SH3 domain-containing protein n=1 Tax=Calycina marina TaxID=1763456 RepID=A0A9P7Z4W6_9HELO|nr:hypothetical protein BJ878DRAFT_501490 [Calycina marina]
MPQPQGLPTRFPCWVQAIHSWGGESKHDLGFVEGELIECLNAGDGSWWMGRLRRDKRVHGLFPCNFVRILDDDFRPASRASSPMPDRSVSPNPFNPQPPRKAKTKAFRKPFQSYAAPDEGKQKRDDLRRKETLANSRASSPRPVSIHDNQRSVPPANIHEHGSRAVSPAPVHYTSRAPSPAPPVSYISRSPSPGPPIRYNSRCPSPAPSVQYKAYSREPSPAEYSPPPPPPPHRSVYKPHNSTVTNVYHTPGRVSPYPPSPGATGFTPSPLRSAMDDVMSSLADMGVSHDTESPKVALDPWSPEAFDQTYINARNNGPHRPNTAMGIFQNDFDSNLPFIGGADTNHADQPPQLSNYVQRMETRLNKMHASSPGDGPPVPPKTYYERPKSSMGSNTQVEPKLRHRKSAYNVVGSVLNRTFTTKTDSTSSSSGARSTTTNGSASTQMTDRSLMSGASAGAFSYTSAGSLSRRKDALKGRARSAFGSRKDNFDDLDSRPQTPLTGISYHSSHTSDATRSKSQTGWHTSATDSGILGGLATPKPKKSGFFKKIINSAKTGAASARSSIVVGDQPRPQTSSKNMMPTGISSIAGVFNNSQSGSRGAAGDMGLSNGVDWIQVRRDINRSNSLSRIERAERMERCQMMDYPAIRAVDELYHQVAGDEGADGNPVPEPTDFQSVNLSLVDKNARFINSLPPMTNPASLATAFVCRPYRSEVQKLRAIFTWVSEKIIWEEEFESAMDCRRVIQMKRGCAEEVAVLMLEMCAAVGIQAEIIRGYLKTPGEQPEMGMLMPRSNHWWNAVLVEGQWRMIDCSLSAPSNPLRGLYSNEVSTKTADSWYFLARPMEFCWSHVPEQHHQQHLCPPIAHEILLSLPGACPQYFKEGLQMLDYDTSLIRIEDLEQVHVRFTVPADIECFAEVEARAFEHDVDGDVFESGDLVKKRALAQAEWIGGQKRYTVKAVLPGDEGNATLKIYAGKRGLMHSIREIIHPLAIALPIIHTGDNPSFEFVTRHPTPHAQRYDLYVAQPQCQQLAINNTYVFAVRQHPSSLPGSSPGGGSPIPFVRPNSAMSMTSSAADSNPSTSSTSSKKKHVKLAIQSPAGKILRLMRKDDRIQSTSQGLDVGDGGTWETIIKCGERGTWRGLVLADRSARWCVFAEWDCV